MDAFHVHALETALDHVTTGVAVLDRDGRLVYRNRFLGVLMEHHTEIQVREGRLMLDGGRTREFREILEAVLVGRSLPGIRRHLTVRHPEGHSLSIFISAVPPKGSDVDSHHFEEGALVFVRSSIATAVLNVEGLARAFDLSSREQEVLLGLSGGKTLSELADDAGRSTNTVRSQLKSIFRKTGVSRQNELVRLVLTSTAFLLTDTSL